MQSLDAILFDLGGTLDGRDPWRDRFHRLFVDAGLTCTHADRVRAFDYAEQRSRATPEMAGAGLRDMLRHHVAWQLASLEIDDAAVARQVVDQFMREVTEAAAANCRVLAKLAEHRFRMGIVSNACGNAAILCDEYGFSPYVSVIVDSQKCGHAKPDLAIFRHALSLVGTRPERTAFVGDSLDRDIAPARMLGMRTFWIAGHRAHDAGAVADADVILASVADLPAHLIGVAA